MAVSTIGSTAAQAQANTAQAAIGQEDFLKILLTQMNYQDPLKPLDNQEFLAQMAQFSSLEQSRQLNDKVENLLAIQSTTQSVGLLGRTVNVSTDAGFVTGQVTTLTFQDGTPQLTVKVGDQILNGINLSQVTLVR